MSLPACSPSELAITLAVGAASHARLLQWGTCILPVRHPAPCMLALHSRHPALLSPSPPTHSCRRPMPACTHPASVALIASLVSTSLPQANAGGCQPLLPSCTLGSCWNNNHSTLPLPAAGQCRRGPTPTSILHSGVLLEQQPSHPAPTCCRPMPAGANPYFQLTEEEAIELTKAEQEENP